MSVAQVSIGEDEKKLVLARLDALPPNMGIAIGDQGNFSIAELRKLIEDNDDLGRQYVEMQLEFLRSIKDGSLFD